MRPVKTGLSLLEAARAFRPLILRERDQIETSRQVPDVVARELARAGFFRMSVPSAYGGLDLTPMAVMEVLEELARADGSVAWCVWNGNAHWTAAHLTEDIARTVYADSEAIFANSTRPSGQADIEADGYRLNGRWSLVSGCQLSDWMILLSTVCVNGKPRLSATGVPENRFMLCRSAACEIIDTWTVGGLRGTGSHDVVVQNMFVPGGYASSFADPLILSDPQYGIPPLSRVIPGLGAITLGVARSAIDAIADLATNKLPDRASKSLREHHGAQTRLSQAEALVRSARLYLFAAVGQLWELVMAGQGISNQARADVRLATSHAVSSAVQAVDLMYAVGGASSLYTTCLLERAFRDIHAMTQHISVHSRILETTGRVLFGLEPDVPI